MAGSKIRSVYIRDTQKKSFKIPHPKKIFLFCNNLKYIEMEIMTPTKICLLSSSAVLIQLEQSALGPHGFLYILTLNININNICSRRLMQTVFSNAVGKRGKANANV